MTRVPSTDTAPERQSLDIHHDLDTAKQLHVSGKLSEAETIYRRILVADPNQHEALHMLGVMAYQFAKYDVAVELITKALAIDPDNARAFNNLANAYKELGKPEKAIANYCNAVSAIPEYAEAHSNLGVTFTLRSLCAWLGIEEVPSLYQMTAQGKQWWGDPSSPDYDETKPMSPFGTASTKRPVGSIFSETD